MYPIRSLDSSDLDHSANPGLRYLSFKRLDPKATLPTRGSSQAAGLDIFSIEEVVIEPKQRSLVRTGLAVAIPEGHYGRIAPRSGLATRRGLDVLAGVIDSDYRGEVRCLLYTLETRPTLSAAEQDLPLIIEKYHTWPICRRNQCTDRATVLVHGVMCLLRRLGPDLFLPLVISVGALRFTDKLPSKSDLKGFTKGNSELKLTRSNKYLAPLAAAALTAAPAFDRLRAATAAPSSPRLQRRQHSAPQSRLNLKNRCRIVADEMRVGHDASRRRKHNLFADRFATLD